MPEVDVRVFESRLEHCSAANREVVAYLRKAAECAGPEVLVRAHSKPGGGWGITYKRANRVFCRFDPKPMKDNVFAYVPGEGRDALKAVGTVPDPPRKDDGWVKIANMTEAERLVPLIQRAFAEVGVGLDDDQTADTA